MRVNKWANTKNISGFIIVAIILGGLTPSFCYAGRILPSSVRNKASAEEEFLVTWNSPAEPETIRAIRKLLLSHDVKYVVHQIIFGNDAVRLGEKILRRGKQ